ncbi:MAG: chromosome segregation protein SMC, partial [Bacteroidota bacterium]
MVIQFHIAQDAKWHLPIQRNGQRTSKHTTVRLKTLEIKGFKSFANQTIVNFGEDVIGIVGPNGSGKSNIVDAIRWVLGEQKSRELRLDTMSSVIFNGTKKRKAGNVASVALTFENTKNLLPTEYSEVKIERLLYRSGDSEYRLNDVPCRLKDITSLFLDTGIGSNSYAIIALGMVDDILADKDNSRRKMFEQAAGISKYKKRKKETLSKLKSTTADLERVEDLLFEINNNLKTLEKQAKRTRKYFELKEQYKQLSIDLAIMKVAIFKERKTEVTTKLSQEEDRHRQMEVELRQLEARLEREKKSNLDREKELSDRQREVNHLTGRIRGMENDKKILEQKINFVQQNETKLKNEIQQNKAKVNQLEIDIHHYRSELNGEKRVEVQLEEELDTAEAELTRIRENHTALKSDLDAVMHEQQQTEREVFELEKKKAINNNRIENLQLDAQRNQTEITERSQEVVTIETQIQSIDGQVALQQKRVEELEHQEHQRLSAIESLTTDMDHLRKQLQVVNRTLDANRNEYQLTKSMVENLEGFPESIKFLSKNKSFSQQATLLSDLIYVKEGYRIAIENYLDQYLNYYVVRNLAEAHQAIQLLSKSQKGKANFFLLDAFADYEPPMTLLPGAQAALEFVETDKAYRKLVNFLLENVLVVEQEEVASPLEANNMTILSKSGRFIQKKYSLSGGSVGLFEGKKIGRKKNLQMLERAIKKAEAQEKELTQQFTGLQQRIGTLKKENN